MKSSSWVVVVVLSMGVIVGAAQVTRAYVLGPPPPMKTIPPIKNLTTGPLPPPQILPPPPPSGAGGQYPQIQPLPAGSAVPPNYPSEPQINNPFTNLEKAIFQAVKNVTNKIFNSAWYANFIWLSVIFVTFLALFRILWRSAAALAGGTPEGIVKFVLFDVLWVIFIQQLSLHPKFIMEPIYSGFEYMNGLGNQLLYDQTNGGASITDLLNGVANTVAGGYSFNPLGIVDKIVWGITLLALLALEALFYFEFCTGVIYLYFVAPFLIRPALAGLMTKPTEGWFPNVVNTGLNQVLKPLIGKAFLWFTFSILNIAVQSVPKVTGGGFDQPYAGALNSAPSRSIAVLAIYLVVLIFGVLLQLAVPTVAKIFSVTINGVGSDLSEDLGGKAGKLALAAITQGFAFGGAVSQLRAPNFEKPKLKGGLKKAPDKPKVVNGELINESSGGSASRMGVEKQFQGASPKQLTDGSTPKSNNSTPSGFSGDGGPSSRGTWRRSKNGEMYAEFSDIPNAPEPRTASAPPSGDALVTEPPEGATKNDREVINAFPEDEDIKQKSAPETSSDVRQQRSTEVKGVEQQTSVSEVSPETTTNFSDTKQQPITEVAGVKEEAITTVNRQGNTASEARTKGEQVESGNGSIRSTQRDAQNTSTSKMVSSYNQTLSTYESNSERKGAMDEMYSEAQRVTVSNIQDVDGDAIPELRQTDERAIFYAIREGNDYLVLPIPSRASVNSTYVDKMYDVKGEGNSIGSIKEPARFQSDGNGTLRLVKKGSLTRN